MSEQKRFGRGRRRGMHFKPSGGQGPRPSKHQEREAQQARAEAVNDAPITGERVFEPQRYSKEIERSENVAAGLPPEGTPAASGDTEAPHKGDYRQPHMETPAEVQEEFEPVQLQEKPRNLLEAIKNVAVKAIHRVKRLIRPV